MPTMDSSISGWASDAAAEGYIRFIKLALIVIFLIIILSIKGPLAAVVMTAITIPLFLLSMFVKGDHENIGFWRDSYEKEDFFNLPLKEDTDLMKKAKKGSRVKQALIEERVRDEIFYTLKNENELSEKEIKEITRDRKKIEELIDNDTFRKYLRNMKSMQDFKSGEKGEEGELFGENENYIKTDENIDFDEKVKKAIEELEKKNRMKKEIEG